MNLIEKVGNRFVYGPIKKTEVRFVRRSKDFNGYFVAPTFHIDDYDEYRTFFGQIFADYVESIVGVNILPLNPDKQLIR